MLLTSLTVGNVWGIAILFVSIVIVVVGAGLVIVIIARWRQRNSSHSLDATDDSSLLEDDELGEEMEERTSVDV